MLWWDMETYMPAGAGGERSEQLGILAGQIQKMWADGEFFSDWNHCSENIERLDFSSEQKSQVSRLGLELAKRRAISVEFAGREARLQSICQNEWKSARQADDFTLVSSSLAELVGLNREKADLLSQSQFLKSRYGKLDTYSILFDSLEPGFHSSRLQELFLKLEKGLKQRLPAIMEGSAGKGEAIPMTVEKQKALYSKLPEKLGMDASSSRLDESTHPFCGGTRGDVRITTRYFANDFSDSMFSVIHETGHGLYEQGIPKNLWHTPLGQSASFGIHESQSRFLENQIGRSDAFCRWLSREAEIPFEKLKASVRRVRPGFIRVAADEVTYNLHVILRWRIEQGLVDGSLRVKDLPEFWSSKFQETMNLKVERDSQGCLQDIHWYGGAFGYFPTYTIGNLFAAELYQDFKKALPNWEEKIAAGEFGIVREFMRSRVYDQAALNESPETMKKALDGGRDIGIDAFFEYIEERY